MKVSLNLTDDEIKRIGRNPENYYRHFFIPDKKVVKMTEEELSDTLYFLPKTDENYLLRYYLQVCGEFVFRW
jgi:hypothetical protein